MYNQMYNIWRVLDQVDTEYCIKHRTDEYYLNMDEYIDIMKTQDKLIVNNLFFIGKDYYISDHIFGCKTKDFKNMIFNLKNILEKKITIQDIFMDHTEKVFGVSYLLNKYKINELNIDQKNKLVDNFYLYDIDRFDNYIVSTGTVGILIPTGRSYNRSNLMLKKQRVYLSKDNKNDLNLNKIRNIIIRYKDINDIKF